MTVPGVAGPTAAQPAGPAAARPAVSEPSRPRPAAAPGGPAPAVRRSAPVPAAPRAVPAFPDNPLDREDHGIDNRPGDDAGEYDLAPPALPARRSAAVGSGPAGFTAPGLGGPGDLPPAARGLAPVSRRSGPAAHPVTAYGSNSSPATADHGQLPLGRRPQSLRRYAQYAYFLLLLAFIPLAWSTFGHDTGDSLGSRLKHTIQSHPEVLPEIERLEESSAATMEDLFKVLPGHRVEGALLPRDTYAHWGFALLAAAGFAGMTLAIFPERRSRIGRLLGIGLFTGTIGILLLLGVQLAAQLTYGRIFYGRSIIVVVFYLIKFIGFSYRAANDPETGFLVSAFGFTFGVGLCEELCKALPVLWRLRSAPDVDSLATFTWRDACRWGFISGAGFGVSEGITYCADFYNGVHGPGIYVVRFVSCVALHAVWAAAAGIVMVRRQNLLHDAESWWQLLLNVIVLLIVPMVLHGLYDTLLKKQMDAAALAVAVASFAWFVWQVERMRRKERAAEALGFAVPA